MEDSKGCMIHGDAHATTTDPLQSRDPKCGVSGVGSDSKTSDPQILRSSAPQILGPAVVVSFGLLLCIA